MRKVATIIGLCVAMTTVSACQVKKTQDAKAPKVDVQGGQLPKYDVKGPDVKVGTKKETVEVPTVEVTPASKAG